MRRFISGFAYVAVGVGLGGLSAYFSIEQSGAEQVADGSAWFKRELSPGSEDGYLVRAHFMLGGRLPPPPGQLTELSADTDDEGRPLRTQCVYRLAGQGPLPRWWSVSVADAGAMAESRQRALDSDLVIRKANGETQIEVSSQPQPGNWLRLPPSSRFSLLYTALPSPLLQSGKGPFSINRISCR